MSDEEDDNSNMSQTSIILSDDQASSVPSTSMSSSSFSPRLTLLDGTFFKYLPDKSTSSKMVGLCLKCSPKESIVKGYNNCTSNFVGHLKRKHGEECLNEYKAYLKSKKQKNLNTTCFSIEKQKNKYACSTAGRSKESKKVNQQVEFEENIVKFFISSMIPLRAIDDTYFNKTFMDLETINFKPKLISRRTLTRRIEEYYTKEISIIKSEIETIQYVCTTADIWSGKKRSFLGVTAHWISNDLSRTSVALACRRFKGVHNFERISEMLLEINSEFGLSANKIVATITDNGSNFVKAFKMFGVKMENINTVEEENKKEIEEISSDSEDENESDDIHEKNVVLPMNLPCCAHTLNLCATDANKILNENNNTNLSIMHNNVMKKCNMLWKAAGRPKSAEIMVDTLKHTLSRPGDTRWNSLYDSLKQIFSIKNKNLEIHRALNIKNFIKESEYDYLEEFLKCAGPIAEALDIMQGENNTYYGIVLPCLYALRKQLKKIKRNTIFNYCQPLIETYINSVEKRFVKYFDTSTPEFQNAAVASVSFPRFKNKWLCCVLLDQRNNVLNIFKTVISKEINCEPKLQIKKNKTENRFFNFDSDSDSENTENAPTQYLELPLTKAELLMLHFFAEDSPELEILNRYPEIKKVFIKYNTILPSSAPVERLFSYATMTNLPKSHRLSDTTFEKRVVLKANLNYKKNC